MLNKNFKINTAEQKEYKLIPEDMYQVKISNIKEVEQQVYNNPSEKEVVINFEFTIIENGEFKGEKLYKKIRPIYSEGFSGGSPSSLFVLLNAVYYGKVPSGELVDVVNGTLGKQVRVVVKHKQSSKDGKTYHNVEDFMKSKGDIEYKEPDFDEIPEINLEEDINTGENPF